MISFEDFCKEHLKLDFTPDSVEEYFNKVVRAMHEGSRIKIQDSAQSRQARYVYYWATEEYLHYLRTQEDVNDL